MKIKKFHQYVTLEKGPVNTAIIDFLKGELYQVPNPVIHHFKIGEYEEIKDYLIEFEKEELIFEVDENDLIPSLPIKIETESFQIEAGKGVDLNMLHQKFSGFKVSGIICNGKDIPDKNPGFQQIIEQDGHFEYCQKIARVDGNFKEITEYFYTFNRTYNSCWGNNVAVTADNKIRPCIHSTIVLGDIETDHISEVLEKAKEYWSLTKDKIEECNVCELRHLCFDCREIAFRETKNLRAKNPTCTYNPLTGIWENKQKPLYQ